MSDSLQQGLKYFQVSDYASAILVVVVYDYFLTFSSEVEYVWLKPWTWVSTLFVLVRYLGIIQALLLGLSDNTSFPSTPTVSVSMAAWDLAASGIDGGCSTSGAVFFVVEQWSLLLFFAAIDLVMVLRIYAMWGRSKIILNFCLFLYVPNTIIGFVFAAIMDNPNTYMSATTERLLNMSVCFTTLNLPSPIWVYLIPTYPITAALLILPLIQTCKESISMYQATKKWQPNQYMRLLVKDGIIYFVVRSSYNIQWGINYGIDAPLNFVAPFTELLSFMLLFSMLPRFIIGIRELYECDAHRQGIDTGFGVSSHFVIANNVTPSGIGLGDDGANGQTEDSDITPLPVVSSRV